MALKQRIECSLHLAISLVISERVDIKQRAHKPALLYQFTTQKQDCQGAHKNVMSDAVRVHLPTQVYAIASSGDHAHTTRGPHKTMHFTS